MGSSFAVLMLSCGVYEKRLGGGSGSGEQRRRGRGGIIRRLCCVERKEIL